MRFFSLVRTRKRPRFVIKMEKNENIYVNVSQINLLIMFTIPLKKRKWEDRVSVRTRAIMRMLLKKLGMQGRDVC